MTHPTPRRAAVALLAALLAWIGVSAPATSVLPINLLEMSQNAERIFVGKVLSAAEITVASGNVDVPAMEYTLQVVEPIKGVSTEKVILRQLGHAATDPRTGRGTGRLQTVIGMPEYSVGGEYLLFLPADSELGLCSPVGLHQGSFTRGKDAEGKRVVVNGAGNAALLRGIKTVERSNRVTATLSMTEAEMLSGEIELTEREREVLSKPFLGALPEEDVMGLTRKFAAANMQRVAR